MDACPVTRLCVQVTTSIKRGEPVTWHNFRVGVDTHANIHFWLNARTWVVCWFIDDWVMAPMSEPERRDFWEIAEDRYQTHSMILTSQLPVSRWHEQIGDPTLADGILDRLVHNAHRIEMRGDSMRKKKGEQEEK